MNLWIPEGGYFVISDVSNVKIPDKYFLDPNGKKLSRDMAFVFWLAREKGVITVPCTSFYDEKKKAHG